MDEKKDSDSARIETRIFEISRQLLDLAEATSALIVPKQENDTARSQPNSSRRSQKSILRAANLTYRLRRRRSNIFHKYDLFGEPAWDILLDLFIADLKGLSLSVTDACIGSAVPNTTALRWIGVLQESGLLTRSGDPRDARRAHLSLTETGHKLMLTYIEDAMDMLEK